MVIILIESHLPSLFAQKLVCSDAGHTLPLDLTKVLVRENSVHISLWPSQSLSFVNMLNLMA